MCSDDAEATLSELEDQLGDLRQATTPIYARTQALTWARENIEKVRCRADNILEHLDLSRKVGATRSRGACLSEVCLPTPLQHP